MRFTNKYYSTNLHTNAHTYYVEIYTQPLKDHLIWKLYHKYDMIFPIKIPGWREAERWWINRVDRGWEYLPFTVRQDLRCYHLSRKNRKHVGRVEVSKDQWDLL